jgi:hypothetical protein
MLALFGAAIFLAAGLVFLVQPMVAKALLPTFGGTPQVWTASLLFFQAALLGGYAYAHASVRTLGLRRQPLVHLFALLLPLLVLPIGLRGIELVDGLPPALAVLAPRISWYRPPARCSNAGSRRPVTGPQVTHTSCTRAATPAVCWDSWHTPS